MLAFLLTLNSLFFLSMDSHAAFTTLNKDKIDKLVGQEITILFLNGEDKEIQKTIQAANVWTKYANINFKFIKLKDYPSDVPKSHVRILYTDLKGQGGNSDVGVGKEKRSTKPTMRIKQNLAFSVQHEFGHVLGFKHEHQHPYFDYFYTKEKVCPTNWDKSSCELFIQKSYSEKEMEGLKYVDPFSVMMYNDYRNHLEDFSFDTLTENDKAIGKVPPPELENYLSLGDKMTAAILYPGRVDKNEIYNIHAKEKEEAQLYFNKEHIQSYYQASFKNLCDIYALKDDCSNVFEMGSKDCDKNQFLINLSYPQKGYPKCVSLFDRDTPSSLIKELQDDLQKVTPEMMSQRLQQYHIYPLKDASGLGYILFYKKKPMNKGRIYQTEKFLGIYQQISSYPLSNNIDPIVFCISQNGNDYKKQCSSTSNVLSYEDL